ncbi:urease accessory UreF family protein [Hydrogenobacter sp. T-2]|uniref:urease accessory protein UreF n=1 Tax=Pampinifervens diazotrophicum TaxID=1632018 RepID=UPI002B262D88|nr:urease accessory UreF family protein [Hydrogenobacter sp. T-2]WPM31268.1 urease accessory UreF family protein [Hydrogenobacter sp. T-2]
MDDTQIIYILTLFDSQLPIGSFVFSWGIETYASDGLTEKDIKELILSYVEEGQLLFDLYTCKISYINASMPDIISSINDFYTAYKYIPPACESSLTLGSNLIRVARSIFSLDLQCLPDEIHFPVGLGIVGNMLNLPLRALLLAYAHSSVKGIINSVLRCIPISSFKCWYILFNMKASLEKCVEKALHIEKPEDIYINTLLWDAYIHKQQFLETRLFEV